MTVRIDFRKPLKAQYEILLGDNPSFLDLSNQELNKEDERYILSALAQLELFPEVRALDLSLNFLGDRRLRLDQIFKSIRPEIAFLKLGSNQLGRFAGLFSVAVEALSRNLAELSLRDNEFEVMAPELFYKAVCKIPCHLKTLDLSDNYFGGWTQAMLAKIARALPSTLEELDLSNTKLGSHLVSLMRGLSSHLKQLHLRGNAAYNCYSLDTLKSAFTSLSLRDLRHLNLENNCLCYSSLYTRQSRMYPIAEFLGFVRTLPKLEWINLSGNGLKHYGFGELRQIFEALPKSLKQIILNNDCFQEFNESQWAQLIAALPARIEITTNNEALRGYMLERPVPAPLSDRLGFFKQAGDSLGDSAALGLGLGL